MKIFIIKNVAIGWLGRYFVEKLMRQNNNPSFDPVPQQALRQSVSASLLKAIFKGQISEGDWLNAQKLAEKLGVSATPVREALVELTTLGIVETLHNRGCVSRPFGPAQLRDIYVLRRLLESETARCACGKIPREALENLQTEMSDLLGKSNQPDWSDAAMALDRQLHQLIAENCGSQRLAEEIARYDNLIQTIRDIVGDQSRAQQRALPEHLIIIEALLANNPEKAAAAMSKHIESTAEAVEKALFPEPAAKEARVAHAVA
jgi:DNA-binding GntR family transcriptional regulator